MSKCKTGYVAPQWVDVGMTVMIPYREFCPPEERERHARTGVRCTVVAAAGYHARIENKQYGIDVWKHIDNLLVECT